MMAQDTRPKDSTSGIMSAFNLLRNFLGKPQIEIAVRRVQDTGGGTRTISIPNGKRRGIERGQNVGIMQFDRDEFLDFVRDMVTNPQSHRIGDTDQILLAIFPMNRKGVI